MQRLIWGTKFNPTRIHRGFESPASTLRVAVIITIFQVSVFRGPHPIPEASGSKVFFIAIVIIPPAAVKLREFFI